MHFSSTRLPEIIGCQLHMGNYLRHNSDIHISVRTDSSVWAIISTGFLGTSIQDSPHNFHWDLHVIIHSL